MCVKRAPEISWKSSPTRWLELPVPADDMVSLPGFALPCATSSAAVFALDAGFVTNTKGAEAIMMTGAKSFSGW